MGTGVRRLGAGDYSAGAAELAPWFLGKILCREREGAAARLRITETEAYCGETDSACHARFGKTERTKIMYRRGGFAYVYLCYGIHWLLNLVTGPEEFPEAVLIRGAGMWDGPGKLTRALNIDRGFNGEDLTVSKRLWLEDDGFRPLYQATPRIGVAYAAPADRERLWRFKAYSDSPSAGST
ncbi:MAG: DNA-3-methyladenine glycosylase [Gracilibacteraceae bacterium]|nr:DNA-3-methyladenine glycosylase [Gracilibacteraceae bacterium]